MAGLTRRFRADPHIRQLATSIIAPVQAKDWMGELQAIFTYVQVNIRYTQDINGVETIQTPLATLTLGRGDCDDMATLLASLAEAAGFPTRFKAVAFDPGAYEHVWVEAMLPDTQEWVAMDATENEPLGWVPDGFTAALIAPVN